MIKCYHARRVELVVNSEPQLFFQGQLHEKSKQHPTGKEHTDEELVDLYEEMCNRYGCDYL